MTRNFGLVQRQPSPRHGLNVLVIGNGAHLTGAPQSLLSLLEHRPPHVHVTTLLLGGGPLLQRYVAASDEVSVVAVPRTSFRFSAIGKRTAEEVGTCWKLLRLAFRGGLRHADLVIVNTVEYELPLLLAVACRTRSRLIVREGTAHFEGVRGAIRLVLMRLLPARNIACVSSAHAEAIGQRLRRRLRHFPNVVHRNRAPATAAAGWGSSGPRFLIVGDSEYKGIDFAARAYTTARQAARLRLVVVGAPSATLIRDPEIIVMPRLPGLAETLEEHADILLGLSRSEPFGRLPVEAALAGLPTLAWDHEGYRETVPYLGGEVIEPFSASALAARMADISRQGCFDSPLTSAERASRASARYGVDAAAAWWRWLLGSTERLSEASATRPRL